MSGQVQDWSLTGTEEKQRPDLPRILVIGAGMAGLVAARLLHDSGFPVIVIEARDRLGGRIWTDERLGGPCDLGGSWIHGADDNLLTNWCNNLQISLLVSDLDERVFYDEGLVITWRSAMRKGWRGLAALGISVGWVRTRAWFDSLGSRPQGKRQGRSVADALLPLLTARWLPTFDRQLLGWVLSMSEGVEGAPADLIHIDNWYPAEAEGANAMPMGGYGQLINNVAQGLDIQLNTPVERVVNNQGGVTLHTPSGMVRGEVALVATPLAILSSGKLQFEPPLPAAKMEAIARIGYGGRGVLNKLFLRFPERFWEAGRTRFSTLPHTPEERGVFTSWVALDNSAGVPVLMGFCDGDTAADLDHGGDDEEIIARGMLMLYRIFGDTIPAPVDAYYTRWLSDPWAMGSYSYTSIYTRPGDRDLYAAPVGDRLYFCGEASAREGYGTVHAALESGAEAAQAIFARYTGQKPCTKQLIFKRKHTP
jgi:polyamine oxidase